MRWLNGISDAKNILHEIERDREAMGSQRVGDDWATEQQQHNIYIYIEKKHAYVHIYITLCVYKSLHTF